ncbi:MAG: hypothetical protein LUO93_08525 [Methanomicrobiales archaeon]|nr:hypothetical protein [Methanomicrobiales archaeon]
MVIAMLAAGLSSPARQTLPPPAIHPLPSNASVRFAVIGNYGWDGPGEADVAAMVHRLNPDLIFTVGDNNYLSGSASTIDQKVVKYCHDIISPY